MFESYGAVTPAGHVLVRGCGYVDHADHIVGPEPRGTGFACLQGHLHPTPRERELPSSNGWLHSGAPLLGSDRGTLQAGSDLGRTGLGEWTGIHSGLSMFKHSVTEPVSNIRSDMPGVNAACRVARASTCEYLVRKQKTTCGSAAGGLPRQSPSDLTAWVRGHLGQFAVECIGMLSC